MELRESELRKLSSNHAPNKAVATNFILIFLFVYLAAKNTSTSSEDELRTDESRSYINTYLYEICVLKLVSDTKQIQSFYKQPH